MTDTVTLTAREHQVLALVAQGLPNKLIADQLGFSEHNAKFHVFNITKKLRARSRAHVVTIAVQRGLLDLMGPAREDRQRTLSEWAQAAFGAQQASSLPQRAVRLLEEALEAYQAAGGDRDMARQLVDFVFGRPVGSLHQELGGVGVCVLLLAAAANLSADTEERREIDRVLSKPLAEFTQRNQAKNDAGFLASGVA